MIYGGHFDKESINQELKDLKEKMEEENFWNDKRKSEQIISEYNNLKKLLYNLNNLK